MNEKEIEKAICYGVGILVLYYIISNFIGYIVLAVIGIIALRAYQDRHKF